MQVLWKAIAFVTYMWWAWTQPNLVDGAPYPTERVIVFLLFILVMIYQQPKDQHRA